MREQLFIWSFVGFRNGVRMQETANKQKRMTLKSVHQMLDGMSVVLAEKVHLLFMAFFDFPRPLLAKRGSTSFCIPSPQAREKLKISRIPHSQSSGIAREACALKGERCVFYEMDINLLCDAQAQYGDYSELYECPMWGMWLKEGGE